MYNRSISTRLLSALLIISMIVPLASCAKAQTDQSMANSNSQIIEEQYIQETVIAENAVNEFITEEIYIEEILIAEAKISELLLAEEEISEVLLCKTIYVPQDNIAEFSENSQTAQLFGEGVDITSLLTKVAVGTGVIVTLVVLSKANLEGPIASIVVAAADKSLQFAETGAAIGSLFGGLTGAADAIDETGRTAAAISFATAVAGLILSTVSLVAEIPSGGLSSITLATGVKLIIAGVGVLTATAGTAYAGYRAVKTFTSTDSVDIDWKNIDWNKVGVASAEKAIENAADGYMWGSIIGAIYGGGEGLEFYQKYNTPYTKYNSRLMQTPSDGKGGHWSGDRGESDFILDTPIELPDGTKVTRVTYKNAVPDFSPFQRAQVKIPSMSNNRSSNFKQADRALAEFWTRTNHLGRSWTRADVKAYRQNNNLTWHEMSNMDYMQLVPTEVNQTFTHFGGVAEYNAMRGQEGETVFD